MELREKRVRPSAVIARIALSGALAVALLSACGSNATPEAGTLHGHLLMVGGPLVKTSAWPIPGVAPIPGSITISAPGYRKVINVGRDGAYAVSLSPGTYSVVGQSPQTFGESATAGDCPAPSAAHVAVGEGTQSDALCQIG